MSLEETAVLITGASAGIGRCTALSLAEEGAWVGLAARREEVLAEVADDVEDAGGRAFVVPGDVSVEAAAEEMVQATAEEFGRLDAVVSNAGIARASRIEEMKTDDYHEVMQVNADGTFYVTRASIPYLRETSGILVMVGSIAGKRAAGVYPIYAATKWWMRGFAKSVAAQYGDEDIAFTVVNPTGVRTGFDAKYRPPNTERYELGERPEPEDVAEAIVFTLRQRPPNMISELDFNVRDAYM